MASVIEVFPEIAPLHDWNCSWNCFGDWNVPEIVSEVVPEHVDEIHIINSPFPDKDRIKESGLNFLQVKKFNVNYS